MEKKEDLDEDMIQGEFNISGWFGEDSQEAEDYEAENEEESDTFGEEEDDYEGSPQLDEEPEETEEYSKSDYFSY